MSRLATELREVADDVPTYDVLDGAIGAGRRRRRRAALGSLASGVVVLSLLAVGLFPLAGQRGSEPTGELPAGPTLPDRVGSPGVFPTSVHDAPAGPASVMFTEASGPVTPGDRLVLVGGGSEDSYRGLAATSGAEPGLTALLSPDGGLVSYAAPDRVFVANLRTGSVRSFIAPVPGSDELRPAAWLPDGTGVIVLSATYPHDPTRAGIVKELGILDLASGGYQSFAAGTWPMTPNGFAVAVSPDGARIAYQFSDFITVYTRVTGAKAKFTLPDNHTALAGKGAWTPDGRSLTVIHRDRDDYPARRWELLFLDPDTGAERDPSDRPSLEQMSLIRLVGWNGRTGYPVVVGYQADATADAFNQGSRVYLGQIHSIGVYEIGTGGIRALIEAASVTNLDVADTVVAGGLTRPGHPPHGLSPAGLGMIVAAGLVVAASASWWLWRRRGLRAAAVDRPN